MSTIEIVLVTLMGFMLIAFIFMLILLLKKKVSTPSLDQILKIKEAEDEKRISIIKEQETLKRELALLIEGSNQKSKDELSIFKEGLLKSIDENIFKMNEKVEERLHKGFIDTNQTFQKIIEQLTRIDSAQTQLEKLSQNIVSIGDILSDKKARGTFGEVQLYHILQNVFGVNKSIYETQKKLSNGSMVDAILYAPEPMGSISIDSKFPLENYRKMIDRNLHEADRLEAQKSFKIDVKKHIDAIASKYIIAGETALQAIMFIPAEAVFAEIHASHDDLMDYAQQKRILLASPTTLIYMLTTVQIVLKNIEQDKNAQQIRIELAKLSEEFNRFFIRWDKLKSNIQTIQKQTDQVDITAGKIGRKFEQISDVDLEAFDNDQHLLK